ncbi:MAG: PDZ domain-containing protein [Pirellulales bacterium]
MNRSNLTALLVLLWLGQSGCQLNELSTRTADNASVYMTSKVQNDEPASGSAESDLAEADETDVDASVSDDPSTERFVQEPARTARRLDFSAGSRQLKHRNNFFMLQAFNEAIGEQYKSTVQVLCDGQQCSLGTIVDSDGWIITKASELEKPDDLQCLLSDERNVRAKLVGTDVEMDIALLRVDASGLSTVQWDYGIPEQGRWLATTDVRSSVPSAIGVVSAGPTRVENQRAVLGVRLERGDAPRGALVASVLSGSGAYEAGIRERDTILQVDGKKVESPNDFLELLKNGKGGQYVKLQINRNDRVIDKRARLMDMSTEMLDETEMEVNGPISARSTGFGRIFMHDTVILPNQCGGPILNLDGKAVGINIARAGRVSTYALPADTINPIIKRLMQNAQLVAQRTAGKPVLTEVNSNSSESQR